MGKVKIFPSEERHNPPVSIATLLTAPFAQGGHLKFGSRLYTGEASRFGVSCPLCWGFFQQYSLLNEGIFYIFISHFKIPLGNFIRVWYTEEKHISIMSERKVNP